MDLPNKKAHTQKFPHRSLSCSIIQYFRSPHCRYFPSKLWLHWRPGTSWHLRCDVLIAMAKVCLSWSCLRFHIPFFCMFIVMMSWSSRLYFHLQIRLNWVVWTMCIKIYCHVYMHTLPSIRPLLFMYCSRDKNTNTNLLHYRFFDIIDFVASETCPKAKFASVVISFI
jgi:hypothetical protein